MCNFVRSHNSSENYLKIIWESSENYHRIILKSSENHLKIIWNSSENYLRIIWELSENHLKIIWKLSETHLRIINARLMEPGVALEMTWSRMHCTGLRNALLKIPWKSTLLLHYVGWTTPFSDCYMSAADLQSRIIHALRWTWAKADHWLMLLKHHLLQFQLLWHATTVQNIFDIIICIEDSLAGMTSDTSSMKYVTIWANWADYCKLLPRQIKGLQNAYFGRQPLFFNPQPYRPDIVHNVIWGEVIIAGNASKLAHFFLLESSHGGRSASTGLSLY